jgi:hypothetical protein
MSVSSLAVRRSLLQAPGIRRCLPSLATKALFSTTSKAKVVPKYNDLERPVVKENIMPVRLHYAGLCILNLPSLYNY